MTTFQSILAPQKRVLIAAAGTGGHIFPGLAVADALIAKGWEVIWLGTVNGMENRLVSQKNIKLEQIHFGGVRGKGLFTWMLMPYGMIKAVFRCMQIINRNKSDLIIGFGGYVSLPVGLASKVMFKPLAIHEQNSVMGLSNKILSLLTSHIYTSFPNVAKKALLTGNPLRPAFASADAPKVRFAKRQGPLRILIVGGSLGARFLNDIVPNAIKLIPIKARPQILHQSGAGDHERVQDFYEKLNVNAVVVPFIENTAQAFADADLIVCRAGASTVTEIAAIGAAALFVPFPFAADDHQTTNALYLVSQNAAWLEKQSELTAEKLANLIIKMDRKELTNIAINANTCSLANAVEKIVERCEAIVK